MNTLTVIILDGVVLASRLFLVSAGLTFVFGVLRILNVAHGGLYALGAYMGAYFAILYINSGAVPYLVYLVLLVAAIAIGLFFGPLIEVFLLRRVYDREEDVQLILTFAVFLILEDIMKLVWGVSPYFAIKPYELLGNVILAGVNYSVYPFMLTVIAVAAGLFMWWIFNRTRFGKIIVSVINDREISTAMGIHVPKVFTLAFTLGAILATIGGAFTAPMVAVVPGIGIEVIVLAFAVVAIGGMGSIGGAALGSLLVGLARAAAIHLFPEFDLFAIYVVMALVLIFRPQGLFAEVEVRRI